MIPWWYRPVGCKVGQHWWRPYDIFVKRCELCGKVKR